MSLSGSQITRLAPGGPGMAYAGFTAKEAAAVIEGGLSGTVIAFERHVVGETVFLIGRLPTGGSVTIKLYDLSDGSSVPLDSNVCTEYAPGLYKWPASNFTTPPVAYSSYSFTMTDGTNNVDGKVLYAGYTTQPLDEFRSIQ